MRVDFYHLKYLSFDQVVPALVQKVYAGGKRLLIKTELPEKAEYVNNLLWTFRTDSWLPHGSDKDTDVADQPILITTQDENLNQAQFVMLLDGAILEEISSFERCFNLFDGQDKASLQNARQLWKAVVAAGFEAYYWQQGDNGRWEMKASKVPEKK